jgi:hypothetical protein
MPRRSVAFAVATPAQAAATSHVSTTQSKAVERVTYSWVFYALYETEPECEEGGLEWYEFGPAADYDCADLEAVCPGGFALYLYLPLSTSAIGALPARAAVARPDC